MALATLQLAAIPVLAGLAAGTGAVATYVAAPATSATADSKAVPCAAQTWPYVDRACISTAAADEPRTVRVVTAPRPDELFDARWTDVPAPNKGILEPAFPGMTTSDGVLRGPQATKPEPQAAKPAPAPQRVKRSEAKPEKRKRTERVATESRRVPVERSGETREVYVMKPLRLDFFR